MQKLIAKYALAAHLAFLAVAPLFLFPFFDDSVVAVVLLWLSLPTAAWVVLQPSVRRGEMLHDARARLMGSLLRDPLFWGLVAAIVFCGVRALNTGIAMVYDAEKAKWVMAPPGMPLFPASRGESGVLPFAVSVAAFVVVSGCRHALGRSARHAWLLVASAMAGLSAFMSVFLANLGNVAVRTAMGCPRVTFSFVGVAFALHFLGGTVALAAAIENKWNRAIPLTILSVGGTAVGMLAFSPPYASAVFLVAHAMVFAYVFFYCFRVVRSVAEFKLVLIFALSLGCGWMVAVMTGASSVMLQRITDIAARDFLSVGLLKLREVMTALSLRAWMEHPWTGTGIGSFAFDLRFYAQPADWVHVPRGLLAPPFGWVCLLVERGIVGSAVIVLPGLYLAAAWLRRLVGWLFVRTAPQPACWVGPLACAAVVVIGFVDCSCLRADVVMAVSGMLALSASSFPKKAKGG